ncbi:GumC family protein [Edaphobacter sp. HDX4]|uniref:GumC family protein n=1 Tax=Edaphobacter sp. HDX4 TaxID=2794064 RepID=UPI002FE5B314
MTRFDESLGTLNQNEEETISVVTEPREEEEISLMELLIVIVQGRRFILKATLAAILLGVVISLILPVHYLATTAILPPQGGSSVGAALMSQLGNLGSVASLAGGSLGLKNPNDLQVAILKSRTIEDAMVDRFNLISLYKVKYRAEARKKLESDVDIDNGAKDGLIRISVTDSDPHRAAEIANAYVDEYKKRTASLAVTEASQRRMFFEQQLAQAKDNLAKAEEDLKKTEQKTGVISLDAQARAAIQLVADLRAQIAAKEAQIAALRSYATAENPGIQIAEQELAGLRAQEQKMAASSGNATKAFVPQGSMQEAGIEYVRKLRDVKYYETIFDLLARQYEVAKVDEARQGAIVQVVDPAVVPERKSFPKRSLIVLGFAILGLIGSTFWVMIKEKLRHLSSSPVEGPQLDALKQVWRRNKSVRAEANR